MKNNDWLKLPIFLDSFYPDHIMAKARAISINEEEIKWRCEEIAKNEQIKKGIFVNRYFPYEKIALIDFIQEDPDDKTRSDIWFLDEDFSIVNIQVDELMAKIHKFLSGKPKYRLPETAATTTTYFYQQPPIQTKESDGDEDVD